MKPTPATLQAHEARTAAEQRAASLWPHQPALQAKWLRAVEIVRSTSRGWRLDNPLTREQCNVN